MNKPAGTNKSLAWAATSLLALAMLLATVGSAAARSTENTSARTALTVTSPQGPTEAAEVEAYLDDLMGKQLADDHISGAAISVVKDGKLLFAKGYGYADREKGLAFDPESTVVPIGSISKLFTATAVMQLVELGQLDLDADINTYLDFRIPDTYAQPITLKNLLTHTAGFDDRNIGKSAWTQESQIPLGDFLATRLPRRICPPGEVYTYSNFSNALAGFVVEEVAHEDYATYVRHNVLEPLGMETSDYRLRPDLRPLLAQCYSHDGTGYHHNPFDFINDYPGGQMLSTGRDMAKFMIAHLQLGRYAGRRILSEESATAMHSVQFTQNKALEHAVGYSFGIVPARSQTVLMHDGGYTGIGCRLCLCPESRFGFFVACNIFDGALIDEVSRKLLELFIPASPQDSTKYPLAMLPKYDGNIAEFAGTYRFSRYAHNNIEKTGILIGMSGPEMTIGRNEEGMILMSTFSGKPRRMIQIQPCLFQSIDDKYMCAFRRDASGEITHLFTNGTTAFEKISWYETATFQRSLFGICFLAFTFVSVALPITQKIRKTRKPSGLRVDPVRWLSEKTASTFLVYLLGSGIVAGIIVPKEELAVGFAHGIHWTMYVVQTIALLGILSVAGLLGLLFWRFVMRADARAGERARSVGLGLVTSVVGVVFVWFLWYWNLIGYQF